MGREGPEIAWAITWARAWAAEIAWARKCVGPEIAMAGENIVRNRVGLPGNRGPREKWAPRGNRVDWRRFAGKCVNPAWAAIVGRNPRGLMCVGPRAHGEIARGPRKSWACEEIAWAAGKITRNLEEAPVGESVGPARKTRGPPKSWRAQGKLPGKSVG